MSALDYCTNPILVLDRQPPSLFTEISDTLTLALCPPFPLLKECKLFTAGTSLLLRVVHSAPAIIVKPATSVNVGFRFETSENTHDNAKCSK